MKADNPTKTPDKLFDKIKSIIFVFFCKNKKKEILLYKNKTEKNE